MGHFGFLVASPMKELKDEELAACICLNLLNNQDRLQSVCNSMQQCIAWGMDRLQGGLQS